MIGREAVALLAIEQQRAKQRQAENARANQPQAEKPQKVEPVPLSHKAKSRDADSKQVGHSGLTAERSATSSNSSVRHSPGNGAFFGVILF